MEQIGPKLQELVAADCISQEEAYKLSDPQKTAIENLPRSQIETLKEVRQATGPIFGARMI